MKAWFASITNSKIFQNTITSVIIFAGALVGFETYPELVQKFHVQIEWLNTLILAIFTVEIVVKMGAEGNKPWFYFKDPWNVFDFIIVAVCFLPIDSQYAMILRLMRLLRVLKLIRALPRLQVLVIALMKSIPSMGYISLFLFLLFYIYAVTGTFLFSQNDPIHFGNLQTSLLSLFRVVTLEDWTDVMYIQMKGCAGYEYYSGIGKPCLNSQAYPWIGQIYFVSFVLIGTMIILNLFIGVIMNGMDEARRELENENEAERMRKRGLKSPTLEHDLFELQEKLVHLQNDIENIRKKASDRGWTGDQV